MGFKTIVDKKGLFPVISLIDSNTDTRADIYAFGALLNAFIIKNNDKEINIIDGFTSQQEAIDSISNGFKSAFLSPFTCRMKEGKYNFADTAFQVDKFLLDKHAIHGLLFDAVFAIDKTEISKEYAAVQLSFRYNKEENGYPFSYQVIQLWKLEAGNKLSVTTTVNHVNSMAIPYAQGWHPYFTLGETVDDCILQFTSDRQVAFDETLLPTGELIMDKRFVEGSLLKNIELDNCFCLTNVEKKMCKLENKEIILTIEPDESYPYLQIYIPPHRKSIAIENLSGAPDCFNNGLGLLLIESHTNLSFKTTYTATPQV